VVLLVVVAVALVAVVLLAVAVWVSLRVIRGVAVAPVAAVVQAQFQAVVVRWVVMELPHRHLVVTAMLPIQIVATPVLVQVVNPAIVQNAAELPRVVGPQQQMAVVILLSLSPVVVGKVQFLLFHSLAVVALLPLLVVVVQVLLLLVVGLVPVVVGIFPLLVVVVQLLQQPKAILRH